MKYLKLFERNSGYTRVIPRDFFNESKLLKCMGVLAIKIHDNRVPNGIIISIEESGLPFDIDFVDDGLSIINYRVTVNEEPVSMKSTYNSKLNFPLICYVDNTDYIVFDEKGEFHEDFIERFKQEDQINFLV